jgi:hypothetical protein
MTSLVYRRMLTLWISQTKRQRMTYDDVKNAVQASDTELDCSLRDNRVLTLNGQHWHSFNRLD